MGIHQISDQGYVIKYSKNKRAQQRQEEKNLESELGTLENLFDLGMEVQFEIESVKRELTQIYSKRAAAARFRSKCTWAAEGEKPSSYFLKLEKERAMNRSITRLRDDKGNMLLNPKEISKVQVSFYQKLYSDPIVSQAEDEIPLSHDEPLSLPQVDSSLAESADRPLVEHDLLKALKQMNNGKSPGTDGLTVEFYKFFWPEVGPLVLEFLLQGIERGLLSIEQCRGIILLIPKKGRDRLNLTNWRPITLLNVDLKILTKAIANKLVPCLSGIIGKEQTGFLKGRFIGENVRLTDDIIDYCHLSLIRLPTSIRL